MVNLLQYCTVAFLLSVGSYPAIAVDEPIQWREGVLFEYVSSEEEATHVLRLLARKNGMSATFAPELKSGTVSQDFTYFPLVGVFNFLLDELELGYRYEADSRTIHFYSLHSMEVARSSVSETDSVLEELEQEREDVSAATAATAEEALPSTAVEEQGEDEVMVAGGAEEEGAQLEVSTVVAESESVRAEEHAAQPLSVTAAHPSVESRVVVDEGKQQRQVIDLTWIYKLSEVGSSDQQRYAVVDRVQVVVGALFKGYQVEEIARDYLMLTKIGASQERVYKVGFR